MFGPAPLPPGTDFLIAMREFVTNLDKIGPVIDQLKAHKDAADAATAEANDRLATAAAKEQALNGREAALNTLNDSIAFRQSDLSRFDAELAQAEDEHKAAVAAFEASSKATSDALTAREVAVAAREARVQEREDAITARENAAAAAKAEADSLIAQFQAIVPRRA